MSYGTPPAAGYGTPPYNQMPQYMMGGAGGAPTATAGPPYGPMHSYNQHGHHAGGAQVPVAVSSYVNPEHHGYGGKGNGGYVGQQLHGPPAGGNFPPVSGNAPIGQTGFPQHAFYNSHSPRGSGPGSPYHSFPNTNMRHPSPPASGGARHPDIKTSNAGIYGYPQQNVGVGGPSPTSYGYNGFGGGGNIPSPHQDGTSGCNPLRSTSPHSPHQNTMYNMGSHIPHQDMVPPSHHQKSSDSSLSPHQQQQQNTSYDFYEKDKTKSPHSGGDKGGYSDNNQCIPGEQQSSDNALKQEGNNFQASVIHNIGDNTSHQQSNKDNLGNNSPVKNEQHEVPGDFSLIKHEPSTDDKVNDNDSRVNNSSCGHNSSEILKDKLKHIDSDIKNENVIDNLDSIPDLPEIPDLKFSDMQEVGKEEPHEDSVRSQDIHNNLHHPIHRESNEYDNQQHFQSHKSSITPPMGSGQSTSGSQHHHPLQTKGNEYDDPTASHEISGGGYGSCEMSRGSGDSGNSSMPPLVAMEGMQANQEAEFMSMNMSNQHHQSMPVHEEGGMPPYQMGMNYGQSGGGINSGAGGQHMWNYYNNSYTGNQQHILEGGNQGSGSPYPSEGIPPMVPDGAGPGGMGQGWWPSQGNGPGRGPMIQGGGDTSPSYRMPPGIQAPGPWALRGQRSRPDRRGPGRPRLSTSKSGLPQGMPGGPPDLSGQRPRLMSPVNQFPPPFSGTHIGPGQSIPQQDASPNDMMPPSPSSSGSGGGSSGGGRKRTTGRPARSAMSPNSAAAAMVDSNPAAMSAVGVVALSSGIPGVGLLPEGKIGKGGSANASKKRYVCEVCQKRFSTAWYVRVHRKSHNGERPYICHNCGKGFMLPNVLQVHLRKCEKNGPAQGGAAPSAQVKRADVPTGDTIEHPAASDQQQYHQQSSPLPQQQQPSSLCIPPHGFPDQTSNPMMAMGGAGNMTSPNPFPSSGNGRTQIGQSGMMPMNNMVYNQRFGSNSGTVGMAGMPTPPFHPNMGDQMYADPMTSSATGTGLHPDLSPHQSQPSSNIDNRSPQQFSPMYSPPATGAMSHRSSVGDNCVQGAPGAVAQQQPIQSSTNSNVPVHFLANDRPLDKGGGNYDFHTSSVNSEMPLSSHNHSPSNNSNVNPTGHDLHCSTCDIQFSEKTAFEEHLKTVHRPFSCDVCERRFSQKCNLITHQRLHTGERPYPCPQCDKRFTQKGNLDAHLKTHTKEKPYPCTTCGKKFAFKASMLSHVKQAHGISLDFSPGCGMVPSRDGSNGMEEGLDEIESIKQQLHKYTTEFPPSPSFSPGIPTPQSSLDSLCGNNGSAVPTGHPSPVVGVNNSLNHHHSGTIHDQFDTTALSNATHAPHYENSASMYNNQNTEFKLDHISSPNMSPSTVTDPTSASATNQVDSRSSLVMS